MLLNSPDHTFQVRAVDESGNREIPPATFSWKIMVPPPLKGSITSSIDGNGNPVAEGGSTDSYDITFTFQVAGGVPPYTIRCTLSPEGVVDLACSSPKSYNNLQIGTHTFELNITDSTGQTAIDQFAWDIVIPPPPPASDCI